MQNKLQTTPGLPKQFAKMKEMNLLKSWNLLKPNLVLNYP